MNRTSFLGLTLASIVLFLADRTCSAAEIEVSPAQPAPEAKRPSAEVAAAIDVGRKLRNAGNDGEALRTFEVALAKSRSTKDWAGEAMALNNIASVYRYQAGLTNIAANQKPSPDLVDKSADLYEQALKAARAASNKFDEAYAQLYLGVLAAGREDSDKAFKYYEQALATFKALDDRYYVARTYMFMGTTTLYRRNQPEASLRFFEQALPMFRDVKYWHEAQWVAQDMVVAYQQLAAHANGQR